MKLRLTRDFRSVLLGFYVYIAIGTLVLVLSYIFYLRKDYRDYLDAVKKRMNVEAIAAATSLNALLGSMETTFRIMDSWIMDNPNLDPRKSPEFLHLVDQYRASTKNLVDVRIVDDKGRLFYFDRGDTTPRAHVWDREYVRAQKGKVPQTMLFAEPVMSRVTLQWGFPVTYHLHPNTSKMEFLFMHIETGFCDDLFRPLLISPNRSITIFRADSIVLMRSPFSESMVGKQYRKIFYGDIDDNMEFEEVENPIPELRVTVQQKVSGTPLTIVIGDSWEIIRNGWIQGAILQSLVALFLLTGFLFVNILCVVMIRKLFLAKELLKHSVLHDPVTGLKNRMYFRERVGEEMARTFRNQSPLSLLLIDLGPQEKLNEQMSNSEMDAVLKRIANLLQSKVRATDVVGRLDAQLFAVLLVGVDCSMASVITDRICHGLRTFHVHGWPKDFVYSIVQWKGKDEPLDKLLKRGEAHLAQYAGETTAV